MQWERMPVVRRLLERRVALPLEKRLSRDAVVSLFIHSFYQFGASMSGVFLNLYLWRLTHSLWINGLYSIILYAVTPLAFAWGGWIAKKRDRLVSYRFGTLFISLFYLAVVIMREQVVEWYGLFAVFNGLANGFYWIGYLTLMYEVSTEQNRIRYLAANMIWFTAAGLAGPALAGFVISRSPGLSGYVAIFSTAFFMFLLTALGSLRIKAVGGHHKAFYLKFSGILLRKHKEWRRSLYSFLILGLYQGIMLFLPNILLFQVLPHENLIGYYGVLFSGMSIAMGILIGKYARMDFSRWYLLISAMGMIVSAGLLLWKINLATVVGFLVIYSLFSPLQGNTLTTNYYYLIGKLPLKGQMRIETIVLREVFMNVGRVLSIFIFISSVGDMHSSLLPVILAAASLLQFAAVFFVQNQESDPAGG